MQPVEARPPKGPTSYRIVNRSNITTKSYHHPNASKCKSRLGPSILVQSLTASLTPSDNPVGPHAATRTRWVRAHSLATRRTIECTSGRPGTAYGGRVVSSTSVVDAGLTASILGLGSCGTSSRVDWPASFSACDSDILVMCTRMFTLGCASRMASSGTKPASWAVDVLAGHQQA